jgi:signal transduction histidine kinase
LGIRCVFESNAEDFKLETVRSLHVFRIVQEAITNSVRHGKAKNVRIELATDNRFLKVSVMDDGIGLSAKTRARPGLGLRVMQYRATILGASLTFERTTPAGGTTVICSCPL